MNHNLIYTLFNFNHRYELKTGIVSLNYSCNSESCDFINVLKQLEISKELDEWKSKKQALEIINSININQDDYLPDKLAGIYIKRNGITILSLNNECIKNTDIIGVIDLNEYKKAQL